MLNNQSLPDYPENHPHAGLSLPASDLSPILRMRQIATEIRGAITRNDLQVVCQAVSLLASTLERCKEMRDSLTDSAGEAAQIAMQTHGLLQECELILTQAMREVSAEIGRLKKGQKVLTTMRAHCAASTPGRTLDTSR